MARKSKVGVVSESAAEVRPRHAAAIDHLLKGKSVKETAQAVGYNESHLSSLIHENPVFRAELNRRRSEVTKAVQNDIREFTRELIARIRRAMDDPKMSPGLIFQIGLSTIPKLWDILRADDGCTNALQLAADDAETRGKMLFQEMSAGESVTAELKKAQAEL